MYCSQDDATVPQCNSDGDLHIQPSERVQYRMIKTPKNNNVIDAVYFAELMYKGVDKEEDNFSAWNRKTERFKKRKHDKIPSNEQRWADPFVFTFQLDPQCNWWREFNFMSSDDGYDCENPVPGKKKKYTSEMKKRKS